MVTWRFFFRFFCALNDAPPPPNAVDLWAKMRAPLAHDMPRRGAPQRAAGKRRSTTLTPSDDRCGADLRMRHGAGARSPPWCQRLSRDMVRDNAAQHHDARTLRCAAFDDVRGLTPSVALPRRAMFKTIDPVAQQNRRCFRCDISPAVFAAHHSFSPAC